VRSRSARSVRAERRGRYFNPRPGRAKMWPDVPAGVAVFVRSVPRGGGGAAHSPPPSLVAPLRTRLRRIRRRTRGASRVDEPRSSPVRASRGRQQDCQMTISCALTTIRRKRCERSGPGVASRPRWQTIGGQSNLLHRSHHRRAGHPRPGRGARNVARGGSPGFGSVAAVPRGRTRGTQVGLRLLRRRARCRAGGSS
jgi:hypothetical protein